MTPKWFPNSAKWLPNGPKLIPNDPKWFQIGWFSNVPKWYIRTPEYFLNGPKWFPNGQTDSKWTIMIPKWCKHTIWNWLPGWMWQIEFNCPKLKKRNWKTNYDFWELLADTDWFKLTNWYRVGAVDLWSCYIHVKNFASDNAISSTIKYIVE